LSPERHRYTWELLAVGLRMTVLMVMALKHQLHVPRPVAFSPTVQPVILTPGYTALPSGHATEAAFAAEVLAALGAAHADAPQDEKAFPLDPHDEPAAPAAPDCTVKVPVPAVAGLRLQLHRMAYRVAENRVVAGLHFPIDSIAGHALGIVLARYFLWRCGAVKALAAGCEFGKRRQDKGSYEDALTWHNAEPEMDCPLKPSYLAVPQLKSGVALSSAAPVLKLLWARSRREHHAS
jgi:membrane-associated phospholipid phosphatase